MLTAGQEIYPCAVAFGPGKVMHLVFLNPTYTAILHPMCTILIFRHPASIPIHFLEYHLSQAY